MRRTFAPIRLVALALPMLSLAFVLPTTATAQSSVAVKTALFKDIASYPEQNVPAQVVAANQVLIAAQISGVGGASYTSNGWYQSLQSALKKAGL